MVAMTRLGFFTVTILMRSAPALKKFCENGTMQLITPSPPPFYLQAIVQNALYLINLWLFLFPTPIFSDKYWKLYFGKSEKRSQ